MSRGRAVSVRSTSVHRVRRSTILSRGVLFSACLLCCCLLVGTGRVEAADPPAPASGARLTFRFKSANPPLRTGAPFSVECVFNSTFADVLTGELEIEYVEYAKVELSLRTDPIAVPSGKNSYHLLLPPVAAERNAAAFSIRVRFHSSKGEFDLGKHDLLVPMQDARQFLIAAPNLARNNVARLAGHLRLDAFRPDDTDRLRRAGLITLPIEVDLPNFASQAINLYPFDLLLLAEDGFSRLSARQLDAVGDWVEQGGRVVLVPTGVLTPAHQSFLNRITRHAAAPASFKLDPLGHLESDDFGSKAPILSCRDGFGRALVLRALPEIKADGTLAGINADDWTRAVCFLWNVSARQTKYILQTGAWERPKSPERNYDADLSLLRPYELAAASSLRQLLFPRAVRVMPFGVVATILALFLLAIAPGDYYLYGFLRRWPIRWIAFPATCLAFTLGTVWIAGNYTGRADHRNELVIVDLGEDGKPLRTSRIELMLTATTRPATLELHNSLFAQTDVQPATTRDKYGLRRPTSINADPDHEESLAVPSYAGTLPSHFTVTRLSHQWSPSMHRVTRPGADVTVPPFAWPELDSLDLFSVRDRQTLVDSLRQAAPKCDVLLENPERVYVSFGSGALAEHDQNSMGLEGLLRNLSRRREGGLFSIVSHVAPSGAGDLEDLAVIGPDTNDHWLLQVAVHEENGVVVFRKMFHSKPKPQSGPNR